MKRVCLAALFVTAALSAHADGERWSMIPACESEIKITSAIRIISTGRPYGYRLLHAKEDFATHIATIEFATRDDHGTFVHHSARCRFWHFRLSAMSIDEDVEGHIIVD